MPKDNDRRAKKSHTKDVERHVGLCIRRADNSHSVEVVDLNKGLGCIGQREQGSIVLHLKGDQC